VGSPLVFPGKALFLLTHKLSLRQIISCVDRIFSGWLSSFAVKSAFIPVNALVRFPTRMEKVMEICKKSDNAILDNMSDSDSTVEEN
jgi:hypothetical protein